MSGYYLCEVQKAQHPYYIARVNINIYTIEELCFYLRQNIYLVDETIVNEDLCAWIEAELQLKRLAMRLREQLKKSEGVTGFILLIFREINYLTPAELKQTMAEIAGIEVQPDDQRRKLKADHLVKQGVYGNAINEYYKILKSRNTGNLGTKFFASVLDNMAVAYARQFLFEEAADCLWQSYGIVRSGETWRRYLAVLPLYLNREEYRSRLEELVVAPEQVRKIEQRSADIIKAGITAKMQEAEEEYFLKNELERYRRSTSFS